MLQGGSLAGSARLPGQPWLCSMHGTRLATSCVSVPGLQDCDAGMVCLPG